MKPLDDHKAEFEVFFLRMHGISERECTAFVLPQELSLKPGAVRILVSSWKEDKRGPFRVRITNVTYKKIKKLTLKEIKLLAMDKDDEILDPEGVKDHCWFHWDAIELLPEEHPNKWIESATSLCEDCADKVLESIRESCVKKETCQEFKEYENCAQCRLSRYEIADGCGGDVSDSVGSCQYEWSDENSEHNWCGNLINYSATYECADSELEHFKEHGFDSECDFDRHSLKGITEGINHLYKERSKEDNFLQKMLFHAIWDTHWGQSHAYKTNPVVGYHTFEIIHLPTPNQK